jgi:hypothetical protein
MAAHEHLDLVKLVNAKHAPRVLARRAGLAPKAGGLGDVAAWQFIEDLCRMKRRERNLRRAGEIEVLALDSVNVDRLGWKEPVPYIASCLTSTGGNTGTCPRSTTRWSA